QEPDVRTEDAPEAGQGWGQRPRRPRAQDRLRQVGGGAGRPRRAGREARWHQAGAGARVRVGTSILHQRYLRSERGISAIISADVSATELRPVVEADEWRTAQSQFDEAAEIIHLEPWLREVLREVQREFACHFPVKMDDGHTRLFTGYRVQHNINRGPAKGGIRYHPDVSLNEVKALAMWMTWK